jgi:urease beta subunit
MADAAGAFGTALGVEGFAMDEGAAEDIAEVRDLGEEAVEVGAHLYHYTDGTTRIYMDDTQHL